MEFTCSGCGLTYCGTPIGSTELCEDCVDSIHKELIGGNDMIIDECVYCECTTEVDSETFMCEGCTDNIFGNNEEENKGMKFIDAIQKYDKITKSGHKVFYMHKVSQEVFEYNTETGVGTLITADIRLLTSDGWYEYKEDKLILPKRYKYSGVTYFTVSTINNVYTDVDQYAGIDTERFNTYNYFIDRDLAQYVADKQLLDRVKIVLHTLNKDKFGKADRCELIDAYIRYNFKDTLFRINEYETKNRV